MRRANSLLRLTRTGPQSRLDRFPTAATRRVASRSACGRRVAVPLVLGVRSMANLVLVKKFRNTVEAEIARSFFTDRPQVSQGPLARHSLRHGSPARQTCVRSSVTRPSRASGEEVIQKGACNSCTAPRPPSLSHGVRQSDRGRRNRPPREQSLFMTRQHAPVISPVSPTARPTAQVRLCIRHSSRDRRVPA